MLNGIIPFIPWILLCILYAPLIKSLYTTNWASVDYTHAYFILPVSLWLTWRMRERIAKLINSHNAARQHAPWYSLPLLLAGLFLCLLGWRQGYISIQTFSLIPVLFGLTGYLYGAGLMKLLSFPIAYLILMVPPPMNVLDSITLPMRYGISVATEFLLKTAGYGINRDGLLLSIGGHEIYMGAPCSGFRSLITMISLGLAYIYIGKSAVKKKIVLLASIVPLALLGNLIRVVGMCLVSFYLGETAGVKYHDYSGFIIFIVLIFGLIGLENFLEKAWK